MAQINGLPPEEARLTFLVGYLGPELRRAWHMGSVRLQDAVAALFRAAGYTAEQAAEVLQRDAGGTEIPFPGL